MAQRDPFKWVRLAATGVTLVLGWAFIFWHNKFHLDPPVVIVALAYLAVVLAIANLWRVGASAVSDDHGDDTWERPLGARDELEREKRTLLKAIKESEFDLETGKLSRSDADALIQMYRARAIEVIKELERLDQQSDAVAAETPRQKIERELAARLAIADKISKKKDRKADKADKADPKASPAKAETAKADATKADAVKAEAVKADAAKADAAKAEAATADATKTDAAEADAKADAAKADATADAAKADVADGAAGAAAGPPGDDAGGARHDHPKPATEEAAP